MGKVHSLRTLKVFCGVLAALVVIGCGGGGGGSTETSRATIVLSGVNASGSGARLPVPDDEVYSLLLDVTRIEFQRCDGNGTDDGIWEVNVNTDPSDPANDHFDPSSLSIRPGGMVRWVWTSDGLHTVTRGEGFVPEVGENAFEESREFEGEVIELFIDGVDGDTFPYFSNVPDDIDLASMAGDITLDDEAVDEDDSGTGGIITVYVGLFTFDVMKPTDLSEVLSSRDLPSGRYCKIRLYVQNPRLLLDIDVTEPIDPENPPQYREDVVKLTANGRLFIGQHFELEPGEEEIIEIEFLGLHLVQSGSSEPFDFVLTPQMRADVDVTESEIEQTFFFVSVDCATDTLVVENEEGEEFTVAIGAAAISDSNETELACEDLESLVTGDPLEIEGTLSLGNMIAATSVEVELEGV